MNKSALPDLGTCLSNNDATSGDAVLDIVAANLLRAFLCHLICPSWEVEPMWQLDEARRHIDQLLWQIHDLTEEIGRLEMEIASLEDSN